MEDNSSITAHTYYNNNSNFEDECRISLSRFNKTINGRNVRYIKAKASLMDDEVDEAHDLFYLVKMPDDPQSDIVTEDKALGATSSATQFENNNKDG